jgi:hypothetical protein
MVHPLFCNVSQAPASLPDGDHPPNSRPASLGLGSLYGGAALAIQPPPQVTTQI